MTITERIFVELSQKNISQKDFAVEIDVNEKTVSAWKRNNSLPPADKLSKISDCLGVSLEYLITGSEKNISLPEDEQKLIDQYNRLPPTEKIKLVARAEAIADVYEEQVETKVIEVEPPMIEIRHSIYKVSAGTGYDLDDGDQWDTIEIPDTPEANRADFALTISGDSMEPVYYSGDIVLIKSQPAVDSGEIGIFIVENAGYIKKYGGDRLISLNAKYDDIMFSDYNPDDIRCVGLVIGRV